MISSSNFSTTKQQKQHHLWIRREIDQKLDWGVLESINDSIKSCYQEVLQSKWTVNKDVHMTHLHDITSVYVQFDCVLTGLSFQDFKEDFHKNWQQQNLFSPFSANGLFLYLLKTSQNVFRAYGKTSVMKWVKDLFIPSGNYMFKVNNRNTRARCKIYSKLTIKTQA